MKRLDPGMKAAIFYYFRDGANILSLMRRFKLTRAEIEQIIREQMKK